MITRLRNQCDLLFLDSFESEGTYGLAGPSEGTYGFGVGLSPEDGLDGFEGDLVGDGTGGLVGLEAGVSSGGLPSSPRKQVLLYDV